METKDVSHFGLGSLLAPVKSLVKKETLMSAAKLGAGAAGGILAANFLMSRVLVKDGVPLVPVKWSPLAMAALGIVGSGVARRFVGEKVAVGVVAGTVGAAVTEMVMRFTSPAAAAQANAAEASEMSGYGPQFGSLGNGRAFARGLSGFSGLGALPAGNSQVYGVGTPDMSAARMFGGATVAIEETGLRGATVQIEEPSAFAGILQ